MTQLRTLSVRERTVTLLRNLISTVCVLFFAFKIMNDNKLQLHLVADGYVTFRTRRFVAFSMEMLTNRLNNECVEY